MSSKRRKGKKTAKASTPAASAPLPSIVPPTDEKTSRSSGTAFDKLSVRVVEARNLAAKDTNGYSDPYVTLRIEINGEKLEPKYMTSIKKKTLNPTWNERFSFHTKRLREENAELVMKVFDEDRILGGFDRLRKDDPLGTISIRLADLKRDINFLFDEWLTLEEYKGESAGGDLHVQIAWGDLPWDKRASGSTDRHGSALKAEGQRKLRELRELRANSDAEPVKGKSNVVTKNIEKTFNLVAGQVGQGFKDQLGKGLSLITGKGEPPANEQYTAADWVDDDHLVPESDEARALMEKKCHEDVYEQREVDALCFMLACIEHASVQFPDEQPDSHYWWEQVCGVFGVATVEEAHSVLAHVKRRHVLHNLVAQYYSLETHPLYGETCFEDGAAFERFAKRRRTMIEKEMHKLVLEDGDAYRGRLRVSVLEARELPAMDVTHTSDPYCVLVLGAAVRRTKTIMRTLSPTWNEDFTLEVPSHKSSLEVQIWDYNHLADPSYIGNFYVPMSLLERYSSGDDTVDSWFLVEGTRGEVHLKLHYDVHYEAYWRALHDPDRFLPQLKIDRDELRDLRGAAPLLAAGRADRDTHAELYTVCLERFTAENVKNWRVPLDASNATLNVRNLRRFDFLLDAYARRYGVSTVRRHLELLQLFSVASDPDEVRGDYVEVIHENVAALKRAINLHNVALCVKENHLLDNVTELLQADVHHYLHHFKVLLPRNEPPGVLSFLVDLVQEMCQSSEEVTALLDESVMASTAEYFDKVAPDDDYLSTVHGMSTLRELLLDQRRDDALFKHSFENAARYDRLCVEMYAEQYLKHVEHFCATATYDPACFTIYRHATELLAELRRAAPDAKLPDVNLFDMFTPFIYDYLKEAARTLRRWVRTAVKEDEHEPIGSGSTCHSLGVTMIASTVIQAYSVLEDFKLNRLFMCVQFAELACDAVRLYARQEAKWLQRCLYAVANDDDNDGIPNDEDSDFDEDDLDGATHGGGGGGGLARVMRSSKSRLFQFVLGSSAARRLQPLQVSVPMCVCLCNVEEARFRLDEIMETLNDEDRMAHDDDDANRTAARKTSRSVQREVLAVSFDDLSQSTFSHLKETRDTMLQALCDRLHDAVEQYVDACDANIRESMEAILAYYDEQWKVLNEYLPKRIFRRYLELAWLAVTASLKEKLLTALFPGIDTEYILTLERYFHADGSGLEREWLERNGKALLCDIVNLQQLSTAGIIKEYHACQRTIDLLKDDTYSTTSIDADKVQRRCAELLRQMDFSTRLLHLRADQFDKRAQAFIADVSGSKLRSHPDLEEDGTFDDEELSRAQKFRKRFGLGVTAEDVSIEAYACRCEQIVGKIGRLHVTTNHLCYAASWTDNDAKTPDALVIDVNKITRLRTDSHWTGFGSLHVDVQDGETVKKYTFSHFLHRKRALRLIVERGRLNGHTIEWIAK